MGGIALVNIIISMDTPLQFCYVPTQIIDYTWQLPLLNIEHLYSDNISLSRFLEQAAGP
jgi:hypothetical protein